MLDAYITPKIKPLLAPIVATIAKTPIQPNQLTVTGFLLGMAAVPLIAYHFYTYALILLLANRVIDGLDGALARYRNQQNSSGGFLDITLDFLFYAAIPLGFALAEPANQLAACVLLVAFIGTGSSFLAFAIAAEKFNLDRVQFPHKSFYYMQGLTEGFETILFFILFCLFPAYFPLLAYIFAAMAGITVVTRIAGGFITLKKSEETQIS